MEIGHFTLHHRLVDGRYFDERATLDGQVEPGAVVPCGGRSVRENHAALVPARVALPDRRQIDRRAAILERILHQADAADVLIGRR